MQGCRFEVFSWVWDSKLRDSSLRVQGLCLGKGFTSLGVEGLASRSEVWDLGHVRSILEESFAEREARAVFEHHNPHRT